MTANFPPPAPNVGRFTAAILGLVVFVCVTMIGGTGYLKYQLDRSETLLAAPDSAVGSDQDMFDRLRRDLGYGGFLGLVQNYIVSHDASGLSEMKAHIKAADDIVSHLPDKTPAETRHDLVAIVAAFDAVAQRVTSSGTTDLTTNDLAPLYAALPVIDQRIAASNGETRLAAQNKMQFWAMLLTLVSWCSLIIAAACAAGIYLTLRDKHSAPMRALAQSIQNMARGDMRTAIWGIERQDMIGELARSVDIARYHFSHLPDLSLLSEQGPVRMRFEGGSRSLFEAMMRAISRDSENIRQHASTLGESIQEQKESIGQITGKVEMILESILQRGQNGDAQIKQAIHDMAASAENLKNAHAHAADQLNRMLPYVQERVHGMAEIASITGKQVAQTLQSLTLSEMGLKANAEQTKETLARLSSTADNLGERMFGAINLLQASGKVLAETTEKIQDKLLHSEGSAPVFAPALNTDMLEPLVRRLDELRGQLSDMQRQGADPKVGDILKMESLLLQIQTKLDKPLPNTGDTTTSLATLQMNGAIATLGDKLSVLSRTLSDDLRQALQPEWKQLAAQIQVTESKIEQKIEKESRAIIVQTMDASGDGRHALREVVEKLSAAAKMIPPDLQQKLQDHWYQVAAQIESSRTNIERLFETKVAEKITSFEDTLQSTLGAIKTAQAAIAPAPQTTAGLPAELQKQLNDQWFQVTAQIESMRTKLVESVAHQIELLEHRLADKAPVPSLTQTATDYTTQRQFEQQTQILSELVATLGVLDAHMQQIKTEIHAKA